MSATKPNFFILGAPKCGTTALAHWLGEHQNIYMPPVKEPHYYSTDLKNRQARTQREYTRLFKGVTADHKAIGEASVWYLYSKDAVPNILAEIPDAKFIVCLRNPVEMAYSLHGQHLKSSNEHIADFWQAWLAQSERLEGRAVRRVCEDSALLLYGPACSLGEQVNSLLSNVVTNRVLFILLDEIKLDAGDVYRQVLDFLEVDDDGRSKFPVVNAASQRRHPAVAAAVKGAIKIKQGLRVPRLGTGILPLLSKWNTEPARRLPMDTQTRRELYRYFAADIQKLQYLVDKDLGQWKEELHER